MVYSPKCAKKRPLSSGPLKSVMKIIKITMVSPDEVDRSHKPFQESVWATFSANDLDARDGLVPN
jgi:hypothetical protein